MQHLDLLLQHPDETQHTSEALKHIKHMKTDVYNMRFQSATYTCCWDENGGSSTRSLTPAWSSMLRSGAEVSGVELIGGTDLGRGGR
jgi:hypothetical protein